MESHVFLAVEYHQLAFGSQYLQFEYYTRPLGATKITLTTFKFFILVKFLDVEIMFCLKEDRKKWEADNPADFWQQWSSSRKTFFIHF